MPKWISEEEVRERLTMPKLIDLMAETLVSFSAAQVEQPVRTVVEVASDAFFGVMPALIKTTPALGAKLVTVFGSNIAKGLPTHLATILLLDPNTGALLTVMDGRYITEARTAAVLCRLDAVHGARRRKRSGADRIGRSGAQPPGSAHAGP